MLALLPERTILLQIGSFTIRWYGVLYIVGFALGFWLVQKIQQLRGLHFSRDEWLELLTWIIGGAVIGGRLGYVIFYEPAHFLSHPGQIIAIWQGGMSAHGGFIGVGLALWLVVRSRQIHILALLDVITVPAAIGLALGRVGNWINQELFVSNTAHLLVIGKDVLIALVAYTILRKSSRPGTALAAFLISYSILRFASEYLRIQEFSGGLGLTRGQLLTLPAAVLGGLLWMYVSRSGQAKNTKKSD